MYEIVNVVACRMYYYTNNIIEQLCQRKTKHNILMYSICSMHQQKLIVD